MFTVLNRKVKENISISLLDVFILSLAMPNGTIEMDFNYWTGDKNEICSGVNADTNVITELRSAPLGVFIALIIVNLTGIGLLIYLCFFGEDKFYQYLL